jgi:MerR family copper efflux transcriptional regulator
MNIGEISKRSGVPAKTIRYYEDIGLIKPERTPNGYRVFAETDLHRLSFLGRARKLGFSIEDCRNLIRLYEDETRASAEVKDLAMNHLSRIEEKIAQLQDMRSSLVDVISDCAGDHRPDCAILERLAGPMA